MTIQAGRSVIFISTVLVTRRHQLDRACSGSGGAASIDRRAIWACDLERPAVAATLLDGSTLSSTNLRGPVTVMNVWASCADHAGRKPRNWSTPLRGWAIAHSSTASTCETVDAARASEHAFDIPYPSVRPHNSAESFWRSAAY